MSGVLPQLGIAAVLIMLHALAAGTEAAMMHLKDRQLMHLELTSGRGRRLTRLMRVPHIVSTTLQVVMTFAVLGVGLLVAIATLGSLQQLLGTSVGRVHTAWTMLACAVVAFAMLVIGELLPKRIAARHAERWAELSAGALLVLVWVLGPLVWVLNRCSERMAGLLGASLHDTPYVATAAEIRTMVASAEGLDADRRAIIDGAFSLADHTVRDVLIPRGAIFVVDAASTNAAARACMTEAEFSRAPVCMGGRLDDVVGMVHVKQLVEDELLVADMARVMVVLAENITVLAALRLMQHERAQIALVVDEHGAVVGLVAMEDLLEELVGDIFDETDDDRALIDETDAEVLVVSGRVLVSKLRSFGVEIPVGRSRTIGGFLQDQLGRMVIVGDTVACESFELEVLTMRGRIAADVAVRRRLEH